MKYTNEVFQRLSRGQFISGNSIDPDTRAIYNDIEECFAEYQEYFRLIDFALNMGSGYFYFSRPETKATIENKLQALFSWIDYIDFLKAYDMTFGAGTQFRISQIENRLTSDLGLKDKLKGIFKDLISNRAKIEALVKAMVDNGFAELVNDIEEEYQVTNAFGYIESIISSISINEEIKDEIPE